MTVTETETGTMEKESKLDKATFETKAKTPEQESKVSSEEKIYTESQHEAIVHSLKSEHGRLLKEVEAERDSLKSQIMTKSNELEDVQADIGTLEKKIEDMSSDDPAKFDAVKELKALRQERRDLNTKLRGLDTREQQLTEREKKVNSFELEVLFETVADEYEDGDAARLKKAVSVFENPTEEQVRSIAESFWNKKAVVEEPKTPRPFGAITQGGGKSFKDASADDKLTEGFKQVNK